MNKLFIILITTTLFILQSCDTRKDFIEEMVERPTVEISKSGANNFQSVLLDTIKIKRPQNYIFDYKVNTKSFWNIVDYVPVEIFNKLDDKQILFNISRFGDRVETLTIADKYGNQASATIKLHVFDNWAPVSEIELVKDLTNPEKVDILTSNSYDKDERFGGKVILYEYTITENPVYKAYKIKVPKLTVTFPPKSAPATYHVSVRVMDNDSVWSPLLTKEIAIAASYRTKK